jgi:hypothetical protein
MWRAQSSEQNGGCAAYLKKFPNPGSFSKLLDLTSIKGDIRLIAQAEFIRQRMAPACDTTFGSWKSITPGRRTNFSQKQELRRSGVTQMSTYWTLNILEKGKPVVRPGRKAMGH